MPLSFPPVHNIKYSERGNKIIQNFGPANIVEEYEFLPTNPFAYCVAGYPITSLVASTLPFRQNWNTYF